MYVNLSISYRYSYTVRTYSNLGQFLPVIGILTEIPLKYFVRVSLAVVL